MLESCERSMLAALEDVVAGLKVFRGDTNAESWARRRTPGTSATTSDPREGEGSDGWAPLRGPSLSP